MTDLATTIPGPNPHTPPPPSTSLRYALPAYSHEKNAIPTNPNSMPSRGRKTMGASTPSLNADHNFLQLRRSQQQTMPHVSASRAGYSQRVADRILLLALAASSSCHLVGKASVVLGRKHFACLPLSRNHRKFGAYLPRYVALLWRFVCI